MPLTESLRLHDGRFLGFYSLGSPCEPPSVRLVRHAWEVCQGDREAFITAISESWQTLSLYRTSHSVADVFGLCGNKKLAGLPAWSAALPWGSGSPHTVFRNLPKQTRKNRRSNGLLLPRRLSARSQMRLDAVMGARSHANQFFSLLTSISTNGFSPEPNPHDPMRVVALEHLGERCWHVLSGSHRLTVAAALGLGSIQAEVAETVYLREIRDWGNVANGSFAPEEAHEVFLNAINGIQSPMYQHLEDLLFSERR